VLQTWDDARQAPPLSGGLTHAHGALCGAVGGIPKADYGIRLRAFLALNYVELDLVAFFERFVSVQLNRGIVDENIRPIFASDESVALGVVKPFHLTFVLSHSFLPSFSAEIR
jgi:hypothetical protein